MEDRVLIVVGDKFSEFAAGKPAITVSQLYGLVSLPNLVAVNHGRIMLIPGQGLSDHDFVELRRLAEASPHAGKFDFTLWRRASPRAGSGLSHKRHAANSVISEPRRLDEDVFELDLMVDENCELMGDHQTGQHVQGMILVEAARQAFLAVTEAFFLPDDGTARYFVIDAMNVSYRRFVFPFGARLRYRILEKNLSPTRQRFQVEVAVEQGGEDATVVSWGFTVYPAERLSRKEMELAEVALDAHLAARRPGSVAEAA